MNHCQVMLIRFLHTYKRWEINRLAQTDLVILRVALYEIQFVDEVPTVVAINEALELAKTYSNDKSRKFINGALGKFERQLESNQILG